jgi:Secretion system C-terminal sorting domain/SprB repeat
MANPTTAAYFGVNPTTAVTSSLQGGNEPILPSSGVFASSSIPNTLMNVSTSEYWDINGTTSALITLTWNANSNVATMTSNLLSNLTIVGWNGTQWVEIPSTVNANSMLTNLSDPSYMGSASSLTAGSIMTNAFVTPNTYEVYTLASKYYIAAPVCTSYPNNQYCLGNNVVLKATGVLGATFTWEMPIGTLATVDNSISGESTVTINSLTAASNGLYRVRQTEAGHSSSDWDTILVNGGSKPTINFVSTSCVSNTGEITVNATPSSGLEFAVNGGNYQTSNVLSTPAGSTFVVAVKEQNASCVVYYSGQCVNCNAQSSCTSPAKDSLVSPSFACIGTPIALSNFITNATSTSFTSNGTGTLSTTLSNTANTNFTYTPSATDVANGGVIITATTNDPDGAGPCTSAVKSVLIQLANGLVAPTIVTNSPVCENSTMTFEAVGLVGNISWLGANGYTSTNNPETIANTPANMQGLLTATISAVGCSNVSANTNVMVIAAPNLTVNITPHNELCAGNGNGSIEVNVAGGSGNYTICYNTNLSNCVNGTYANFQYVAPGNYIITVVDQACPNNTFSYPVTIGAGMVVATPVVASTISTCAGNDLILVGTTPSVTDNINWTFAGNNFNAVGNPVIRHNATMAMSGIYFAKTIATNGCASLAVPVNVTVNETPVINHVQVNCLLTSSKVVVTATLSAGTMMYSLDGITYQTSNIFNNFSGGNYTLYVKNSATNCIATQQVLIPNCACPNEPVVTITHPLTSCGLTAIPLIASFTNVSNATWTTAGTGTFSTTNGASGFTTNYTPSNAELVAGECNVTLTTADPDGAGPCTPVSKLIKIKLVNSLQQPTITKNQATYCAGDSVVLMSNVTDSVEWNGVGGFYSNQSNATIVNATQFLSGYYKVTAKGNGCVSKMDSMLITIAAPPTLTVTTSAINETCEGKGNGEITVNVTGGTGNYIVCNDLGINCNNTTATHTFKYLAPATYAIHVSDVSCPNYRVIKPTTVGAGLHVDTVLTASYNNPVCAGNDLVLTATTPVGSTVLWTDGTNNYSAFGNSITRSNSKSEMSGVYKVQRVENGCASAPKYLDVHVYDNPSIATVDTLCIGSIDSGRLVVNATIAPTDVMEYSINGGAFQTSNVFDNLSNGLFQVSARAVGSNCVTMMSDVELYCNCFCNKDATINVFPNPNEGSFAVQGELVVESSDITITVVDMGGRKVYETQLTSKAGTFNHSIDIRRYATGAYLLTLNIDGEKFVKPIMVNR